METLAITCPECGHQLQLRDRSLLGRPARCPECDHKFLLEQSDDPQRPVETMTGRETIAPAQLAASLADAEDQQDDFPVEFGRYQLLEELGEGAMGAVYLARDVQLGRQVALKIPKFGDSDDEELLERFYREARSAATLRHPNVCPVFEVGEVEGVPYITMAYIEGRTLSSYVNPDNQRSERQVVGTVRRLASALAHAHQQGVVHRDLKPANILIDKRNDPIVMDFGLAMRVSQGNERLTQTGTILGTPAYMSPEQVRAEWDLVGPQSDIYSLGVILYELLTAELPFDGPVGIVMARVLTEDPPCPSEFRPDLSPRLEEICLKMMAKEIEDRYQSMREVDAVLAEFQRRTKTGGTTVTADVVDDLEVPPEPTVPAVDEAPHSGLHETSRIARRSPRADETIADQQRRAQTLYKDARQSVVLGDFSRAVEMLRSIPDSLFSAEMRSLLDEAVASQPQLVETKGFYRRFWNPSFFGESRQARTWSAIVAAIITFFVIFGLVWGVIETFQASDNSTALNEDRELTDSSQPIVDSVPDLDEDGSNGGGGDDQPDDDDGSQPPIPPPVEKPRPKLPLTLNHAKQTLTGHTDIVLSVAFSPDGKRIVSGSLDKTLKVWDAQGDRPLLTMRRLGLQGEITSVVFSPNGGEIVSGSRDGLINLWDSTSGREIRTIGRHNGQFAQVAFSPDGRWIASGADDRLVRLWNVESAKPTSTLSGSSHQIRSLAISPDGQKIVSGGGNRFQHGELKVWDAVSGRQRLALQGHLEAVTCVAFSPDGKRIVSGSDDRTLTLWDSESDNEILTFTGHSQPVTSVAFSPAGNWIVSGSSDDTLKVWDAKTGGEVVTLQGHSGNVTSVAVSPDGRQVVSGSSDKTIKIWEIPADLPVGPGRPITPPETSSRAEGRSPQSLFRKNYESRRLASQARNTILIDSGPPIWPGITQHWDLRVQGVTGAMKGQTLSCTCRYGSRPTIVLFLSGLPGGIKDALRRLRDELNSGTLLAKPSSGLDLRVTETPMVVAVVKTRDLGSTKRQLVTYDDELKLSFPLTILGTANSEWPDKYRISDKADLTLAFWMHGHKRAVTFRKGLSQGFGAAEFELLLEQLRQATDQAPIATSSTETSVRTQGGLPDTASPAEIVRAAESKLQSLRTYSYRATLKTTSIKQSERTATEQKSALDYTKPKLKYIVTGSRPSLNKRCEFDGQTGWYLKSGNPTRILIDQYSSSAGATDADLFIPFLTASSGSRPLFGYSQASRLGDVSVNGTDCYHVRLQQPHAAVTSGSQRAPAYLETVTVAVGKGDQLIRRYSKEAKSYEVELQIPSGQPQFTNREMTTISEFEVTDLSVDGSPLPPLEPPEFTQFYPSRSTTLNYFRYWDAETNKSSNFDAKNSSRDYDLRYFLNRKKGNLSYLLPVNGATIATIPNKNFDDIDLQFLKKLPYLRGRITRIASSLAWSRGNVFGLRTGQGHYLKFRVTKYKAIENGVHTIYFESVVYQNQ